MSANDKKIEKRLVELIAHPQRRNSSRSPARRLFQAMLDIEWDILVSQLSAKGCREMEKQGIV